jgi:hypothetical protein
MLAEGEGREVTMCGGKHSGSTEVGAGAAAWLLY